MDKRATTQVPIAECLAERWSPRAFSDRAVAAEQLVALFEAARWAASSYNEQPWRFLVATRDQPEEFARMLNCLIPFNREWAASAPVLILAMAKETFGRNDKANGHCLHDVGQALANLAAQAASMGLQVHMMAGFEEDVARSTFAIPAGYLPATAIAVGYPGPMERIPATLHEAERAPRERKPLEEIVFTGRFGQPAKLDG